MMYINTFHTPQGFLDFLHNSPELQEQTQYEQAIAQRHQHEKKYQLDGYCKVCAKPTLFLVDRISSYQQTAQGVIIPNWRERLLCQHCQLNNR